MIVNTNSINNVIELEYNKFINNLNDYKSNKYKISCIINAEINNTRKYILDNILQIINEFKLKNNIDINNYFNYIKKLTVFYLKDCSNIQNIREQTEFIISFIIADGIELTLANSLNYTNKIKYSNFYCTKNIYMHIINDGLQIKLNIIDSYIEVNTLLYIPYLNDIRQNSTIYINEDHLDSINNDSNKIWIESINDIIEIIK